MGILATKLGRTSGDETRSSIAQTTQEPGKIAKFASDFYETGIKPSTEILGNTLKTVATAPIDIGKDIAKGAENLGADISKIQRGTLYQDTGMKGGFLGETTKRVGEIDMRRQEEQNKGLADYQNTNLRGLVNNALDMTVLGGQIGGDIIFSGLKALTPNQIEADLAQGVEKFAQTPTGISIINAVEKGGEKLDEIAASSPEANTYIKSLKAAATVGSFLTIGKGKEVADDLLSKTAATAEQTGKDLTQKLIQNIPENIRNIKPGQVVENIGQQTDNVSENLLTKLQNRALENKGTQAEDAARKIIQGDTQDIAPAIKTFEKLDLTDVNDYKGVSTKIDEQLGNIVKTQDDILRAKGDVLNIEDATKNIKTSKGDIITNPVKNAINDIDEVITKTGDDLYLAKAGDDTLGDIVNRIKGGQGTIKDYNDLARFYNSEFKNKIYTKTGEAKDSIVADRYEINRTGIKKFVREKLGDDTLRQLDQDYSNAVSTKYLIDKAAEGVNKLEQKLKERGLGYKAFRGILNLVDKTTLGGTKAIRDYFITSNVGNKVNNWIDIQSELKKNIKLLNNALNKPNKSNLQRLDEFLGKVTGVKPKEAKYSFKEKPFTPKGLLPKGSTIPEAPKMVSKDKIKVETPQLSKKQIKNLQKQKKEETRQINNGGLKPKQQPVVKEGPQMNKKQEDNKIGMKPKEIQESKKEGIKNKEELLKYVKTIRNDDIFNDIGDGFELKYLAYRDYSYILKKDGQKFIYRNINDLHKGLKDNGYYIKPKSSTERVTELIQKDREKRGIKENNKKGIISEEQITKTAKEIENKLGLKCKTKLCGRNAIKEFLEDGKTGTIEGGIFIEKTNKTKTLKEAIDYAKTRKDVEIANKKGDVVHIWHKNKFGKITGDDNFTKGKDGFYVNKNKL